ncbi:MAG TPA: tRNA adenosine(34) deaminase TadA [Clostridia bacterium]|nr:tRNA adenosine(34) deaminase TadA [Clostridia bacterium]
MTPTDEMWMEEALRLAARAHAAGEVPVGAVVVRNGTIIGRGWNQVITTSDSTAHAEIVALREASQSLKNYRIAGCQMFVTLEPCAMCAGALIHARLERLVIGADDPKAGAAGSVLTVVNNPALNHAMEIKRGVLAARAMEMLQAFFRERRGRPAGQGNQSAG